MSRSVLARDGWRVAAAVVRTLFWLAWQAVRLPIFSLLVVFEPIARLVFSGLSLLAILTAFLFEASSASPRFPFWGMIAFSVGCALALTGYYALLRLFAGRRLR